MIQLPEPPKWALTWVGVLAAFVHLTLASLGVAQFMATLEPGLYFYGALSGFGTAGAVTLHATGRKWNAARYQTNSYPEYPAPTTYEDDGVPGRYS